MNQMGHYKISIVGSGAVGKAIGKVLTKYGYQVIFCDVDGERHVSELEKVLLSALTNS